MDLTSALADLVDAKTSGDDKAFERALQNMEKVIDKVQQQLDTLKETFGEEAAH